MTAASPRYPFVVPGLETNPNQPLCPWKKDNVTDHEPYYRDVGGHEGAYGGFTTELGTSANLCQTGGVVVVSGPPRSGKSSLINRCVNWIQQGIPDAKSSPLHIMDFATLPVPAPSRKERSAFVADLIRIKLLPLQKPNWLHNRFDEANMTSIETAFLLLHQMRDHDTLMKHAFVIIPPPLVSDTAEDEIRLYRDCVQPGIICMLEHATGQRTPAADPPGQLALRHLEPGEAYQIVNEWPDTSAVSPAIHEGVMDEFEEYFTGDQGGKLSTGMLLATLRELYKRRIRGSSEFMQVDSIKFPEVLKTMLWVVENQSGGRGNPL